MQENASNDVPREVQRLLDILLVGAEELASEVGVAYGTLYAWSVGRRTPNPENARRLAKEAARRGREVSERSSELLQVIEADND